MCLVLFVLVFIILNCTLIFMFIYRQYLTLYLMNCLYSAIIELLIGIFYILGILLDAFDTLLLFDYFYLPMIVERFLRLTGTFVMMSFQMRKILVDFVVQVVDSFFHSCMKMTLCSAFIIKLF